MTYNPKSNTRPTKFRFPHLTDEQQQMLDSIDESDWRNGPIVEYKKQLERQEIEKIQQQNAKKYSLPKSILAEAISGITSAPIDIWDLGTKVIPAAYNQWLPESWGADEKKGFGNMEELTSEKYRKWMRDLIGAGEPATPEQRYIDSIVHTGANFLSGPAAIKSVGKGIIKGAASTLKGAKNIITSSPRQTLNSAVSGIKSAWQDAKQIPERASKVPGIVGNWVRNIWPKTKQIDKNFVQSSSDALMNAIKSNHFKNAALGGAIGSASQYMEEHDTPASDRLLALSAMGTLPSAFKGIYNRIPTAGKIAKGKEELYKHFRGEIDNAVPEIQAGDYGSNYFAKEGAPALQKQAKEIRAPISKQYDEVLGSIDHNVPLKPRENILAKILNKDFKVSYGNGNRTTIPDAVNLNNDTFSFTPKDLHEVTSQVTQKLNRSQGNLRHTLAQDRKTLKQAFHEIMDEAYTKHFKGLEKLKEVDTNYRVASGPVQQRNILAQVLNKETTQDTIKRFAKALRDNEKIRAYDVLKNQGIADKFLKYQTSTQKGAEDFLLKNWLGKNADPSQLISYYGRDMFDPITKGVMDKVAKKLAELAEMEGHNAVLDISLKNKIGPLLKALLRPDLNLNVNKTVAGVTGKKYPNIFAEMVAKGLIAVKDAQIAYNDEKKKNEW